VPDKSIHHTHEGSIGNLCNEEIEAYKDSILAAFNFGKIHQAVEKLLAI
jgi:argininosuccinate lyase